MTRQLLIISIVLLNVSLQKGYSQKNYIKGFIIGVPSQSGAGMGNLAFERLDKNKNTSWQFSLNFAIGTFATDIGVPNRKWITIDRNCYFIKENDFRNAVFVSAFLEAGTRKISAGKPSNFNDSILNSRHAFELNPGIGLGRNFSLGKKLFFQLFAAPKAIIGFHKDKYYSKRNSSYFYDKYSDLKAGYRIMINLCFPL